MELRASLRDFWQRCLIAAATTIATVALLWFGWMVGHALLLIFAAGLVAVGLAGLARPFTRITGLSRRISVVIVTALLALMLALALALGTINVVSQAPKLQNQVAQSIDQLQNRLKHYRITAQLFGSPHGAHHKSNGGSDSGSSLGEHLIGELSSALSVTLASLTDLFIVLIIGIYLAAGPQLYYKGLLRLFPPSSQSRVTRIAHEAAEAMRRWLSGRAISMTFVGLGSIVGLWLIGIPFPLLLGLIAGLFTFIPYLGPLVSAVPALLVASLHGFWPIIDVGLLYLGLHVIEGYLLAPLIQRQAVSIAPAFLLSAQVLGGAVAGMLGVALATPISLVIAVTIQLGYVQNVIGEEPHLPGDHGNMKKADHSAVDTSLAGEDRQGR